MQKGKKLFLSFRQEMVSSISRIIVIVTIAFLFTHSFLSNAPNSVWMQYEVRYSYARFVFVLLCCLVLLIFIVRRKLKNAIIIVVMVALEIQLLPTVMPYLSMAGWALTLYVRGDAYPVTALPDSNMVFSNHFLDDGFFVVFDPGKALESGAGDDAKLKWIIGKYYENDGARDEIIMCKRIFRSYYYVKVKEFRG
ncbi:hypothetical protein B1812_19760 [Methylocystis bryophila]|uniref:Uncharacterized protein n=1 Tax=Methylocystis bryophila TaxID=655015 RepID=A0A1W6MZC7_9HYPH|nr:hypothetical protein B1812_19760 [Methylocystis bryophila]